MMIDISRESVLFLCSCLIFACVLWVPDVVLPVHVRVCVDFVVKQVEAPHCVKEWISYGLTHKNNLNADGSVHWESRDLDPLVSWAAAQCQLEAKDALTRKFVVCGSDRIAVATLHDPNRWAQPVVERVILWKDQNHVSPMRDSISKTVEWWRRYLYGGGCTAAADENLNDTGPDDRCWSFCESFLSHMRETLEVQDLCWGSHFMLLYTEYGPVTVLNDIYQETIARYPHEPPNIRFPWKMEMWIYPDRVRVKRIDRDEDEIL